MEITNFEQRSIFGGEEAPGIRPIDEDLLADPMQDEVIETEVKEVKEELSLIESMNQLTVGTIVPAKISTNIIECKDVVINAVNKYSNIVVTAENFEELKTTRAFLNDKKKIITEQRKRIKDESMKSVNEVYDVMTEIIKSIDHVVKPLDLDIKSFEIVEKQRLRNLVIDDYIKPKMLELINQNKMNESVARQFVFDERWLNKTSFTAKGIPNKRVQYDIEKEIIRLSGMYDVYLKDVKTIQATFERAVQESDLGNNLGPISIGTYVRMFETRPLPDVLARINTDIRCQKEAVERIKKEAEMRASMELKAKEVEQHQEVSIKPVEEESTVVKYDIKDADGKVIAFGNVNRLMAEVVKTPERFEGKTYEYTYSFSGSYGVIKTFSNILKLLAMIFEDFKYERK